MDTRQFLIRLANKYPESRRDIVAFLRRKQAARKLTPSGLNRLTTTDVDYLYAHKGIAGLSKHLRELKEYKHAMDNDLLPDTFYRFVSDPYAKGKVLKDPWWRVNLDHAIEEADKLLMKAYRER